MFAVIDPNARYILLAVVIAFSVLPVLLIVFLFSLLPREQPKSPRTGGTNGGPAQEK